MTSQNVPKSVIIVGGSLSGLMHALTFLSLPSPPKVRILERSPADLLHNQGAGIVAGNDTQSFFEEYVRPEREIAVTSPLRHYLDRHGNEMDGSVEHWQQRMTSWDLLYHLLRWRVDGLETEYVTGLRADDRPKAQYENGCAVTNIENTLDGVKLSWTSHDRGEQSATVDMVVAADGASSTIRSLLLPEVQRTYAGYVAWRGTVPEAELSDAAKEAFVVKFTFYHREGLQAIGCLIPAAPNGTLEAGQRRLNWVWYQNHAEGSVGLDELMTDIHGKRHRITLPVGSMSPTVWEKQKIYATQILPPQFAEVVQKTQQPFVQAITDVIAPQNSFFDGKVLLGGDALAGFRPHTAASTNQAALGALNLGKWLRGEIGKDQYDRAVNEYAAATQKHGVNIGDRSQYGNHPLNG